MNASEILRETRGVLFAQGWMQGGLGDNDGRRCLLGALCQAMPCGHEDQIVEVYAFLECATGAGIPGWNDAPERTFNDVIDALDRAEKFALIDEEG